ncbi:CocE/NonD family hydrolase [Actinomycetes bacterium M1A6_2h]
MTDISSPSTASAMGTPPRPVLPPEGEQDFLQDYRFDLTKTVLPDDILVEQASIPMRDGVILAATVYRSADSDTTPVPVVVTATPYGKDDFDQWKYFGPKPDGNVPGGAFYLGSLTVSDHTAFEAPDPGFWVPNGYAVVLIDLPGFGQSTSNPEHTPGPEARWWDAMQWLEEQPWSTGKLGMSGVSALCATQWIAAKDPAPPQLKAIIAWEGINEGGPAGGYGGIPEIAFPTWLQEVWFGANVNHAADGPEPALFGWPYDTSIISVPALICASFSDQELHTWDTFDAFTRIKSEHKWLFNHRRQKWGAYYGAEELALQKRFLDRFCKDDVSAMDGQPAVRLEINENRTGYKIIETDTWPVDGTEYTKLYLNAESRSLTESSTAADVSTVEIAPSPIDDPDNRAVFDYTFGEDTDLIGHMALTLSLEAIDTTDVDLFVGVEKLDTAGNEVYFFSSSGGNPNGPVTRGFLRASKRTLNAERSTPFRPVPDLATDVPLTIGEITTVQIPLMPSGTTFRAGETLRLIVQCWSSPGQWEGGETRVWDAHQDGRARLHTGGGLAGHLLIPVLPANTKGGH